MPHPPEARMDQGQARCDGKVKRPTIGKKLRLSCYRDPSIS